MITIRDETRFDIAEREALLDAAFGAPRFAKTSERLRRGRTPADGLSFIACTPAGLIGSVRLWDVSAGPGRSVLLLGPLAVARHARKHGVGAALMTRALDAAKHAGHGAVLLVGDATYYDRFGFSARKTGRLWLPGPYERDRLLACELEPGALDGARGLITAPVKGESKGTAARVVHNDNAPWRYAA
ncbi:MAG: GNAT family N-acetyltransferase [Xanthobacteraceae bacterium]